MTSQITEKGIKLDTIRMREKLNFESFNVFGAFNSLLQRAYLILSVTCDVTITAN